MIDGLCDDIRNGQEVAEFTKLLKQINIIETSHDHAQITKKIQPDVPVRIVEEFNVIEDKNEAEGGVMPEQADVQNQNKSETIQPDKSSVLGQIDLDLNMLGSQGFNVLHAACGSGNIEMTKYLL